MHGRHQTGCVSTACASPSGRVARVVGRAEHRGHADAGGRGQVHRAGVVRDERAAVRQHAGQRRQIGRPTRLMQRARRPAAEQRARSSAAVGASAALPTITQPTPSAASAAASSANDAGGQRFAPPYAAPGASATSGARPSQPAPASSRAAASRASCGTRTRGSIGPFGNPSAWTSCWYVLDLMQPGGARDRARQQRPRQSVAIAPAFGNAGARREQRRVERVRQQQRGVEAAAGELGAERAPARRRRGSRPAPAARSSSSISGTSWNSGAIAGRAATAIDAPGAARRTSAIAGSAMTASPSQFGARMTRRFIVWYGRKPRDERAYHDRRASAARRRARPRMKIALLQINPTVGDLAGNARLILDALRSAAAAAPISPPRPSSRSSATCRAICCSAAGFVRRSWDALAALARDAADLPPVLVGLPEPNPSDEGRPLFNSAVLLRDGRVDAALPQGAAAHLRRLRRGPLLRAVPRRAAARPRRPRGSASASARTSGTTATSGSAAAITTTRSRSSPRAGAERHRQPVGVAVLRRQAPPARGDARQHGAEASPADRLRQPVRRQRRPRLRRPQLRVRRRRRRRSRAAARSTPTSSSATSTTRATDRAGATISTSNPRSGARSSLGTRDYARKCGFSQRRARAVGRHRLGADRGDRRRGARRRPRARRADAVAVFEPRQPRRLARAGARISASRR